MFGRYADFTGDVAGILLIGGGYAKDFPSLRFKAGNKLGCTIGAAGFTGQSRDVFFLDSVQ